MRAERRRKRAGLRRVGLLSAVTVAAAVALVPAAGAVASGSVVTPSSDPVAPPTAALGKGPFVTLLFSRTEMSAADNCVEDDDDIATMDGTVAPYLQSLGMAGTGTLVTKRTDDTTRHCTHYNDDLTASWADATNLAQTYGWSFVSHTATYPTLQQIENFTRRRRRRRPAGVRPRSRRMGCPARRG